MSNLLCTSATNSRIAAGGLAQNTRQFLQSLNPGSSVGSSSLARMPSVLMPGKSGESIPARCCALRVARWVV